MKHHSTCSPNYPEKPKTEPPRYINYFTLEDGKLLAACSDCGAYEIQHVPRNSGSAIEWP